jgi:hypothetical protein
MNVVWNNNGEFRTTIVILSPLRNSRTTVILIVPEQQICVWLHRYYFYSENSSYFAVLMTSKHTLMVQIGEEYNICCLIKTAVRSLSDRLQVGQRFHLLWRTTWTLTKFGPTVGCQPRTAFLPRHISLSCGPTSTAL